MFCLDCNAAIAALQNSLPPSVAIHRDRVRYFIRQARSLRIALPSIALSEYLWKAYHEHLLSEIRRAAGGTMFVHGFDEVTATIAAKPGQSYSKGGKLGDVARSTGHERVALKADLMIVSFAGQYSVQIFLTGDPGCHAVASHAGLNSFLISSLPSPPPLLPPGPTLSPQSKGKNLDLFGGLGGEVDD